MRRKILVNGLRTVTALLLLLSLPVLFLVSRSGKGDIMDSTVDWIASVFFIILAIFIYSLNLSEYLPKRIYRKKTDEELREEIKKSNLDKFRRTFK